MLADRIATSMTAYYDWWTQNSSDRVYGFVFFSTSLLEYAGCTVFTEEGLNQVVTEYSTFDSFKDSSIDQLTSDLRWSPADSPHHMTNEEIFSELNSSLVDISEQLYQMEDDQLSREVEKFYDSVIRGIRQFRQNRVPFERDDILVTMLWGNMSPHEVSRFIRACNSEAAALRSLQEMSLHNT